MSPRNLTSCSNSFTNPLLHFFFSLYSPFFLLRSIRERGKGVPGPAVVGSPARPTSLPGRSNPPKPKAHSLLTLPDPLLPFVFPSRRQETASALPDPFTSRSLPLSLSSLPPSSSSCAAPPTPSAAPWSRLLHSGEAAAAPSHLLPVSSKAAAPSP